MISLEVEITEDLYFQLKQVIQSNPKLNQDAVIETALQQLLSQLQNGKSS